MDIDPIPTTSATHGMVSSTGPIATEAGVDDLKSGGNAIDAAVAVGLTLGVVNGHNSGIGGGCFMLIRLADGRFIAIDGREKAPAAATRNMFVRNGKANPNLSQTGALASGVPGEVAAFDYAVNNFGRKKFGHLLALGERIAREGFPLDDIYAARRKVNAADLSKFASSRRIFLKDGKPLKFGDILKQPDLAKTYRELAKHGSDWFYRGRGERHDFVAAISGGHRLAQHDGIVREVFRGHDATVGFLPRLDRLCETVPAACICWRCSTRWNTSI